MSIESDDTPSGPFEGPEKLLEIWFAPSPADVPDASSATDGKIGLRKVPRAEWEKMLDVVKCKVLSVVEGVEIDAYLLRYAPLHYLRLASLVVCATVFILSSNTVYDLTR